MTKDHNQAISNQTIPIQDIFGQFLGLFDQFFGQKYQQAPPGHGSDCMRS